MRIRITCWWLAILLPRRAGGEATTLSGTPPATTTAPVVVGAAVPLEKASVNNRSSRLYLPLDISNESDGIQQALHGLRQQAFMDDPIDVTPWLAQLARAGHDSALTLTQCGAKGVDTVNQDRSFVLQHANFTLLGVLDGHGGHGHHVAQHVQQYLLAHIELVLSRPPKDDKVDDDDNHHDPMLDRLTSWVEAADASIPDEYADMGGTTLSAVLVHDESVYLINTGDSQSVLGAALVAGGADGNDNSVTVQVVSSTRFDKPDDEDEYARLVEAGAMISVPSTSSDDENDNEDEAADIARVYYIAADGQSWGLAMSRSLGDRGATAVIATPTITAVSLPAVRQELVEQYTVCTATVAAADGSASQSCQAPPHIMFFGMSVTDGILDYVNSENLVHEMGKSFHDINAQSSRHQGLHPLSVAEIVMIEASTRWRQDYGHQYRDDMAMAAAVLA